MHKSIRVFDTGQFGCLPKADFIYVEGYSHTHHDTRFMRNAKSYIRENGASPHLLGRIGLRKASHPAR